MSEPVYPVGVYPHLLSQIQKAARSNIVCVCIQEEMFTNRVEVKVKIPEELKPWLVDDWDLITRQKQVKIKPQQVSLVSFIFIHIFMEMRWLEMSGSGPLVLVCL